MSRVPKKFVSLHAHDGFSTFDGLGYPQEHIDFVVENGMDAWCLTNHGHMNSFGYAYLHSKKIKEKGVNFKFIPGCEMYVHPDLDAWKLDYEIRKAAKKGDKKLLYQLREERESLLTPLDATLDPDGEILDIEKGEASLTIENEDETKSSKFYDPIKRRHHLVVIPKTSTGLQRLFHLISQGYKDGFYRFPRVDYKMLKKAAEGGHLMISTACIGGPLAYEVFKNVQQLEFDKLNYKLLDDPSLFSKTMLGIGNTYQQLVDSVGVENVYLELQFNKLPAQHLVNRALIDFAKKSNLKDKLVVTCDSHYARPEHWREREIYKKLGWLNYQDFDPSNLPNSRKELKCELYPKNSSQIWDTFLQTTQGMNFYEESTILDAVERTYDIAHEEIGDIQPDCSMKLPSYVIPQGKSANQALADFCKEGLIQKGLARNTQYVNRAISELRIIKEKDFSEYFLTMKKIIDIAWKKHLVGPARGSGAGSLVNYLLGITNIDPIEYNLLFERFLDPLRAEYPDIDTDVSDRDGLIEDLRREFGNENVVPISNYNTFKLKSLIKDVSRFYGIPFQEVNTAIASLERDVNSGRKGKKDSEYGFDITIEEALKYSSKARKYLEKYPEILEPINVLFKQNKNLGRHAGGVIISERVPERMPLIMAKGELQTPWIEGMTAKHLESFGWVKFDLLGLETLRIIENTIKLILRKELEREPRFEEIREWYKEKLDPKKMNLKDQKVYKHIYHSGKFAAIFQCTQKGAQKLFMKAKPTSLVDIATLTSIYRPGPLSAKVDRIYINAKKSPDSIEYGHPIIKKVLEPTYGCLVFQEQAMALCHEVARIPKIELNKIRKMMKPSGASSENVKKAKELRKRFISGAIDNGVNSHVAEELYEKILYFSGYGFNASHAFSYSLISYYCAWFLTYYETEWVTSYLEASASNPKKSSKALSEVKSLGYKVNRADINNSEHGWTCKDGNILIPSFSSCKGMGESAITEIMHHRPYTSIFDLLYNDDGSWKHKKLNKKSIGVLIQLRTLDSIAWNNEFPSYKVMYEVLMENWNDIRKSTKKDPFKGMNILKEKIIENCDRTDVWATSEIIKNSVELLGTVNIESLLSSEMIEKFDSHSIRNIEEYENEDIYWFMITKCLSKKTKNGKPYLIINCMGTSGKNHKIFCWNTPENSSFEPYVFSAAQLKNSDFGFSTNWKKVFVIEE